MLIVPPGATHGSKWVVCSSLRMRLALSRKWGREPMAARVLGDEPLGDNVFATFD